MSNQNSSYRQIVKATSIFGGVQFLQIIIRVIRSKIVSILLGPEGMGINGLFVSTKTLITGLSSFGLGSSAVKDIAEARATNDEKRISTIVSVFRRLVWITGLLGAIFTLVTAPWLSKITFGSKQYTLAFVWLSVTLLFAQLTSGQFVILQSFRKIKLLAKAKLYGSIVGLFITIPLYYFFGIDGIVPGIILSSISLLVIALIFGKKIEVIVEKVTLKQTLSEGKGMLQMGFFISLGGLLSMATSYVIRIFINHAGGVGDVGLYHAGFNIIDTYVGLIFTAMATDYYPRLAAVADKVKEYNKIINQQAEVAILILAPILLVFLVFIQLVITILYSNKFIPISGMVQWASMGIFFKATSWAVAFIYVAKGEGKVFFWNDLLGNFYMLGLTLLGYYLKGLEGIGIAFLVGYILYLIQVFIITKAKYKFAFEKGFIKLFILQVGLAIVTFVVVKISSITIRYVFGSIAIIISVYYSYIELDKRIDIKQLISKKNK